MTAADVRTSAKHLNATSQEQSGGITANTVVLGGREAWWKVAIALLGALAALVGILSYFGIQPKHKDVQLRDPVAVGTITRNSMTSNTKDTVLRGAPVSAPPAIIPQTRPQPGASGAVRSHWAFNVGGDSRVLTEIRLDGVDDTFGNPILLAVQASLHGELNFKPARIVDVISATVTESYSVAGCATAEQATLEYEVDDLTSSGSTGGAQSVTGRGICIGAERKEATVQSIESAAGTLKARLRN
jgi:hypothetical protein